jgi:signal transduction histidine kinase
VIEQHTYRVLLIEDNPADARLAREILAEAARYTFDIAEAASLEAAITLVAEREFDVVLMDLSLPDSQGLDGVAQLRAKNVSLPIVVLTGLNDEETAIEALQRGVQDYMVKGIEAASYMVRAIRYAIERKRIEFLLVQATQQAELANRAKSEFLSTMSHELRTPLNAIIGFAELMKLEAMGPIGHDSYREYASDICLSGNHLLTLINDILDLGRIEAGKADVHDETLRLSDVFEAAARIVRERAATAGLQLDVIDPVALPPLRADRRKMLQILVNLLSNAIKFTPERGRVQMDAEVESSGELLIRIADTGIGIAPNDLEKAMMPFGQIDSSLSRKHAGTGLGLPLTKNLIELHGGDLELASALGVGTTAIVRLPAARVVHAKPPARPARANATV